MGGGGWISTRYELDKGHRYRMNANRDSVGAVWLSIGSGGKKKHTLSLNELGYLVSFTSYTK